MATNTLEELTELHKTGAISNAEFEVRKSQLSAEIPTVPTVQSRGPDSLPEDLSPVWRRRFEFFEKHGSPFSKSALQEFKSMDLSSRAEILINIWALLFGIFYYIFLGIPKRGLSLLAIGILLLIVLPIVDESSWLYRAAVIAIGSAFCSMANYYYFIKVTRGRDEWDPLKDVRTF